MGEDWKEKMEWELKHKNDPRAENTVIIMRQLKN